MIKRRTAIKWLHWSSFFLFLYFFLVEPEDVRRLGAAALATHAGVGVLLAIVTTVWIVMTLVKGLAGRAGPKLPALAKKLHPLMHKVLLGFVAAAVLTGALAGFAAPYVVLAFGVLPISTGAGSQALQGAMKEVHEIAFNLMMIGVLAHAVFHLWRHYLLTDNALRIMIPKALHRYL